MRKHEIMSLINTYLSEKRQQRCTAHIMIDIHMKQGGFGEPQFNILHRENIELLANGLRFDMEN